MEKNNDFVRSDNLLGNSNTSHPKIGTINFGDGTSTDTTLNIALCTRQVESFVFDEEKQTIEAVVRETPIYNVAPDDRWERIFKEIYGVVDGVLKLIEKKEGKINPGYYVEESIDFD